MQDFNYPTIISFLSIFSYVPRIVIASLVGFLLGELSNAWLMDRIKRITGSRLLWLRTIGSSVIAYLLDTVPFVVIAFAGTITLRDMMLMIAMQYVMKVGIETVIGTPLAYAVIGRLNRITRKVSH